MAIFYNYEPIKPTFQNDILLITNSPVVLLLLTARLTLANKH